MQLSSEPAVVILDLVKFYKSLYQLTPDELSKDERMLAALQKYHAADIDRSEYVKNSDELKMWVTLNPNPENVQEV